MKRRVLLRSALSLALFFGMVASAFSQDQALGGTYAVLGTNPDGSRYEGSLEITRAGKGYKFTWIVGETYTGTGTLSGTTLTVQWDYPTPVVYQVVENGRALIGTWENGAATEIAWRTDVVYKGVQVKGSYRVQGTNPDGTVYTGQVSVTQSGNSFTFSWNVGQSYQGKGKLDGEVMTVDWGDEFPVVYKVLEGGNLLIGTWADGYATEVLFK